MKKGEKIVIRVSEKCYRKRVEFLGHFLSVRVLGTLLVEQEIHSVTASSGYGKREIEKRERERESMSCFK